MNAKEKFKLFEGCTVRSLHSGCALFMHYEYFRVKRNVMRGLEEHLAIASYENIEKHDFINKAYVYEITNVEGDSMCVKFDDGLCVIASKAIR